TEEKKRQLYTTYAERSERIHAVNQLLRGYTLYEIDKEYVVEEGKVKIVDEHTGRVLGGRRYSDGLHQAIEAKENVKVQAATQTYATITIQNYFRLYAKLAGMTGTAETEAEEFDKIYKLPVIVVPTNKPVIRADREDYVYKTKRAKLKAVLEKIHEYHDKGQPVLVGTASVESSETISRLLKREGVPHHVLNAKASRAASEAEIVAQAGQKGAVTIATNMAGRGTDIKLGEGVREMGGLAILGTERHESRRIDNQLRGRAGRQGDPGESRFYVSLEDDLMRLFGHDRTARIMDKLGMEEDEVIEHKWITKGIERSQTKVEQNNFAIRKRQLEYDDVLNAQREVIYDRRMHALQGDRLRGDILDMLRDFAERTVQAHFGNGDLEEVREALRRHLAFDMEIDPQTAHSLGEDGLVERILDEATAHYRRKRAALARPYYQSAQQMLERAAVLSTIDAKWTEHLRDLDEVKEGVGLRAYGQKDPLIEYKMEAYRLFKEMIQTIDEEVVSLVFKAGPLVQGDSRGTAARRVQEVSKPRMDASRAQAQHEAGDPNYAATFGAKGGNGQSAAEKDPTATAEPIVAGDRVGRNDPCPCGSGKKFKHCHGRA
ncbi:MAG TPA: preprotein translocase subunit SecA, partial [Rhodothermales bacterium]|nr:preprotein translocase subunit SecA [Rhodothermales bacterium]